MMKKTQQSNNDITGSDVTGIILAGGQATRMQGRDKGLLGYRGKLLIEWVIASFSPQVVSLSLNVNRSFDQYRSYNYPLLPDEKICEDDYQGPLAGIYTGLSHCQYKWLACIPCDVPDVPLNLVSKLLANIHNQRAAYAYVEQGHYLCCLLSVELKESLKQYLISGDRAVHRWFAEIDAVAVDFSESADCFININDSDQLE